MKKRIFTILAWTLAPLLIAAGVYALDGSGWDGGTFNTASPAFTGTMTVPAITTTGAVTGGATQLLSYGQHRGTIIAPTTTGAFYSNAIITAAAKNVIFSYFGKPAIMTGTQTLSQVDALPDLSNNHTGGVYNVVEAESLVSADAQITKNVIAYGTGWDYIIKGANFSILGSGNLESAGTGTFATGGSTNHTVCWKAGGVLGYCSSVVGVDGTCTCN